MISLMSSVLGLTNGAKPPIVNSILVLFIDILNKVNDFKSLSSLTLMLILAKFK